MISIQRQYNSSNLFNKLHLKIIKTNSNYIQFILRALSSNNVIGGFCKIFKAT